MMTQKKKAGIILVVFAAVILVIAALSAVKERKNTTPTTQQQGNVYNDIPDAEPQEMKESKSDAYMTSSGSAGIEDYWNDCEDEYAQAQEEQKESGGGSGSTDSGKSSKDLFGSDESAGRSKPQGSSGGGNPYRESARDREQRHQKRREEAIELADRMQNGQNQSNAPEEEPEPETITIPSPEVRRSDVISSLDDSWSDSGVSSLDDNSSYVTSDEEHPFKCMFVRGEKIKSGQRVSVRLLEDIVVGGILIPKNSHLMASCTINRRLEMEIANIEMQGRILALGYEAFDTDGTKGIYCPDTGDAGKTIKNRGTSLAGTALSSRVGRLASDVVTTGVSLIESASGERTVSVPAGYTFFIVKKKQP